MYMGLPKLIVPFRQSPPQLTVSLKRIDEWNRINSRERVERLVSQSQRISTALRLRSCSFRFCTLTHYPSDMFLMNEYIGHSSLAGHLEELVLHFVSVRHLQEHPQEKAVLQEFTETTEWRQKEPESRCGGQR
jgi:hypothetical protein